MDVPTVPEFIIPLLTPPAKAGLAELVTLVCFAISGSSVPSFQKIGISAEAYHILDWQYVAVYFNQMDGQEIRNVSLERFGNQCLILIEQEIILFLRNS